MDHDRLFKELLKTFFIEFLELFVPEIAKHVDRKSVVFLDKEIFTDIGSKERHEVDLLVKVKYRGRDAFFLIHVENQAKPEGGFPRRMFLYFSRLDEKYGLPVFPIALFSYDRPRKAAATRYQVKFPRREVLSFRFHAIQLNRLNWRNFLKTPNPVASALMTKMKIAQQDRPRVKLEILRMIVRLKLDKARATLIGTFMENYLKLTAEENLVYNREMATIAPKEKKKVFKLTNEWIEQGIEQGIERGKREAALRLLTKRFGPVPKHLSSRIEKLSESALTRLLDAVLDFQELADAEAWVAARK